MKNKEELTPELEQLISKVKLKEPPQELMKDYLSGVNAKIDQGIKSSYFGFSQFTVFLVIGVVLAGVFYFFLVRLQVKPVLEVKPATVQRSVKTASVIASEAPAKIHGGSVQQVVADNDKNQASTQKPLTIEEGVAVLEAFGDEFSDESPDVFGDDDEALDELAVLDEVELSAGLPKQPSGF